MMRTPEGLNDGAATFALRRLPIFRAPGTSAHLYRHHHDISLRRLNISAGPKRFSGGLRRRLIEDALLRLRPFGHSFHLCWLARLTPVIISASTWPMPFHYTGVVCRTLSPRFCHCTTNGLILNLRNSCAINAQLTALYIRFSCMPRVNLISSHNDGVIIIDDSLI